MDSHEGDVRLIFKHFPDRPQAGRSGRPAAWAAHQQQVSGDARHPVRRPEGPHDEDLGKLGAKLGLDLTRYEADRHSDATAESSTPSQTAGNKGGATGTP